MILVLLGGILYLFNYFILHHNGGLISPVFQTFFHTFTFSGVLSSIVYLIFKIADSQADEIYIFVFLVCLIGMFFLVYKIQSSSDKKQLMFLDSMENTDNIELISSPSKLFSLMIFGVHHSHPICLTWALLKQAIVKWELNDRIWTVYAKFISIHHEEQKTLNWISNEIHMKGFNSIPATHLLYEIRALFGRRESTLSPRIKKRLTEVNKIGIRAKLRIRKIWDFVIQGNVKEMESLIAETMDVCNEAEDGFQGLVRQFPNCRFVLRVFAKFKLEIRADSKSYQEMKEQIKLLQFGQHITQDTANSFGLLMFPNLPMTVQTVRIEPQESFYGNQGESFLGDINQDDIHAKDTESFESFKEKNR